MTGPAGRRGIVAAGAWLPHRRLDRSTIRAVAGAGGGRGARTVASYDEDSTTMAVEAARAALRPLDGCSPDSLWFATTAPAYLDKTNATTVHAALRLDPSAAAFDVNGAVRSSMGAVRAALGQPGLALVAASDLRTGLPGSADEAAGGDGAAAIVVGDAEGGPPLLAESLAWASTTEEFVDRWRLPGEVRSKVWEERFGETRYLSLGVQAWDAALEQAGLDADQVDRVVITGPHARACTAVAKKLSLGDRLADDLAGSVGHTGAAHALLLLTAELEAAPPGRIVAVVSLADGADVWLVRTADAVGAWRSARPVAAQVQAGAPVRYGTYLAWRGLLPVEPPRRPEPARVSAAAANRSAAWKLGFVGSTGDDGSVHLPPLPGDTTPTPMADATGTVVTFTVDRLAYSPSPPIVFAVVDFDGGGRLPVELTDVDIDQVRIGARVEMTFRRLHSADGIHNYFWKVRLAGGEV